MMWFFAILVVLVMGGVAVVAAGHGAPMAEAYDDRPDVLVPTDRPLRATDLRKVRFSLAVRGYRMSEVDALLDRLATQMDRPVEATPETTPETVGEAAPETSSERPPGPGVRGDGPVT